jgi:hypothetical protein
MLTSQTRGARRGRPRLWSFFTIIKQQCIEDELETLKFPENITSKGSFIGIKDFTVILPSPLWGALSRGMGENRVVFEL